VFENRVLRTIFGPKRDEVKGKWRRLLNEELNNMYSSPDFRTIKSRRKRWVGYVARMERRGAYRGRWGNLREIAHLEDPGVDGRMLKWIFRKWDRG
jgi:hypothetical protein